MLQSNKDSKNKKNDYLKLCIRNTKLKDNKNNELIQKLVNRGGLIKHKEVRQENKKNEKKDDVFSSNLVNKKENLKEVYQDNFFHDSNNLNPISKLEKQHYNMQLLETIEFEGNDLPLYIYKDKYGNFLVPNDAKHGMEIKYNQILENKPLDSDFKNKLISLYQKHVACHESNNLLSNISEKEREYEGNSKSSVTSFFIKAKENKLPLSLDFNYEKSIKLSSTNKLQSKSTSISKKNTYVSSVFKSANEKK